MAYEMKENSGSLFKNDRRESDTHPLYKGSALIGGVEYWLDCWLNEDRSGGKYMSLKFKPKEARTQAPVRVNADGSSYLPASALDDDSDVPF